MSNKLQTSNSSSALDKLNRTIENLENNKKGVAQICVTPFLFSP